jgi:hypothetical protein
MLRRDRARLGLCDANRSGAGELSVAHSLVNLRRDDAKRQTEALQKRSAVARRRRQDQHCRICLSFVEPREVFVFTLFFDTEWPIRYYATFILLRTRVMLLCAPLLPLTQ